MLDLLQRIFGRESQSKDVAKERLRLVLVHDRASVRPEVLDKLKEDLIKVISHYLDIDQETMEVSLAREDNSMALVANIPIVQMRRQTQQAVK